MAYAQNTVLLSVAAVLNETLIALVEAGTLSNGDAQRIIQRAQSVTKRGRDDREDEIDEVFRDAFSTFHPKPGR